MYDQYGLPDGPGADVAWEDLARGVEAAVARAGADDGCHLYGVVSPVATTARHGGDTAHARRLLGDDALPGATAVESVVMDVVLAGTAPDPWSLVVGEHVPADVVAVLLVRAHGPGRRSVVLVSRAGRVVVLRRDDGPLVRDPDHAAGLVNALRHLLDVPVATAPLSVPQWLGRLTAACACRELLNGAGPVDSVVLDAAAHVATLAQGAATSGAWGDLIGNAAALVAADIDWAWFDARTLAWFAADTTAQQGASWQALREHDPAAACQGERVLAGLGWAEPAA